MSLLARGYRPVSDAARIGTRVLLPSSVFPLYHAAIRIEREENMHLEANMW